MNISTQIIRYLEAEGLLGLREACESPQALRLLRALLDPREVVLAVAVVAPKVPPVSLPLLLIAFHRVALPLTRATKPAHAALASAFALAAIRRHLSNLRGAILLVTVGVHARHRPSRCQVVSTAR